MNLMARILLTICIVSNFSTMLWSANAQTYTASVTMPLASGVTMVAQKFANNGFGTPISGTTFDFDPLKYNPTNESYYSDHYFAVDVWPLDGAGTPDVTVTYTEGVNPNNYTGSVRQGLGAKVTATFVKLTNNSESYLVSHGPDKLLNRLNGEHVTAEELGPTGRFRLYIALRGGENFTGIDRPGVYTGSILISATVS